jgi:hypothetical protein
MSEVRYLEAPRMFASSGLPAPYVFLAGGITGCPDWQAKAVAELSRDDGTGRPLWPCTILNPRREQFPMDDHTAAEEQITWEHQALRAADINAFWFCKDTVQPIVLFELGATMERMSHEVDEEDSDWVKGLHLVIGVEEGYSRTQDVEIQTKLALGYRRQIDRTFDQFLSTIKSHINWFHDEFGRPE